MIENLTYNHFWLIYTFLILIPFYFWMSYPQRKYYQLKLEDEKNKRKKN
jgi:preprotein translocase subunit YajC